MAVFLHTSACVCVCACKSTCYITSDSQDWQVCVYASTCPSVYSCLSVGVRTSVRGWMEAFQEVNTAEISVSSTRATLRLLDSRGDNEPLRLGAGYRSARKLLSMCVFYESAT